MTKVTNEDIGISRGPVAADSRLKKPADEGRTDRSMEDRKLTENRELTDPVRASARREEFVSNILPDPPKIPGYHLIWLSTTNDADTIPERMRRGYEPVKLADIPGYDSWQIKSGEHQGMIGIREMLLFKIPLEMYEQDMAYLHHEAPLSEERSIKEGIKQLSQDVGEGLSISKGIQELAAPVRTPRQWAE